MALFDQNLLAGIGINELANFGAPYFIANKAVAHEGQPRVLGHQSGDWPGAVILALAEGARPLMSARALVLDVPQAPTASSPGRRDGQTHCFELQLSKVNTQSHKAFTKEVFSPSFPRHLNF